MNDNKHSSQVIIAGVFRRPVNSYRVIINCSVILMDRLTHGGVLFLCFVQRFLFDLSAGFYAGGMSFISLNLVSVREIIFLLVRMNVFYFQDFIMLSGNISIGGLEMCVILLILGKIMKIGHS